MIVAEIYTQTNGKIAGFVLKGHSDGNERGHGYNIHCAEVSVLSQSAYLGILKYLNRAATNNNENGGLGIKLEDAPDDLTEAIFQIMIIGLRKIEKIAPDIVKIQTIQIDAETENNFRRKINDMKPTLPETLPKLADEKVRIRADIFRNDDGKITGFSIKERKAKNDAKVEIYRAGIWSLSKATSACVKDYLKRDVTFDSGSRRLVVKLKTLPDDITEAVFQTMIIGLREIERQAPQIIQVS